MSVNPNIVKKAHSDELDLGKIFSALLAKWYYFVIALILFVSLALFYLYEAVPTFQATSSIIVKESDKTATGATLDLLSGDMFAKQTNVSNVQSILSSNTVLNEVIKRLEIINTVYDNTNLIAKPLYKNRPFKVESAALNKWYYNSQKFYIKLLNERSFQITFDYDGSVLPDFHYQKIHQFGEVITTKYFSFRLVRNDSVPIDVENASDFSFICEDMPTRTSDLLTNLTQTNPDKTTIINLAYKDNNPQLCLDVLNTMAQVFIENELALKRNDAYTSLAFIDQQLEEKNKKLEEIEQQLQQYKSEKGITDPGAQSNLIFLSITNTEKLKSDNDAKQKSLDNLSNYIKSNSDMSKLSPSSVGINDQLLENLINDYQDLLTKIQGLETAVSSPTPQLKALKQQLETKKQSLIENIQSIKSQTIIAGKQLQQEINKYQSTIASMPEKEKGLIEIQRQQSVTQEVYQYLLQKKQETLIATQTATPDNRVQDKAVVATKPVAPVKMLILAIAVILSFIFPATIIFIQNVSRSTVANRDDIDFNTTIPVLGIIGKMRGKDNNYVNHNPKSIVAECFRSIRTNIQLAETGNDKKVIMITSTVAGEGKSYTALNLAVMFALQNHKTLLLGFDFRKPRLFKEFGLNNDKGLSSFLHGKASMTEIIQKTELQELDLITAGPIPDNPSELLSKNEVAELFKTFRAKYDYIIIDTPPIGVLSDAYVIMKYSDMNLYVIREHFSKTSFIRSLNDLNLEGKVWNMHIILNAANLSKKFNANYGHYHGYSGKYRYYADNEVKPGFFKRMFRRD
ncbi:MAG: polysaccharide biosynthesis tyrosine autokinase [Bacteroidia bacterium]